LSNDLILLKKERSLDVISINNDIKIIAEIQTPSLNSLDIDKQKNILCVFNDYIKIFPELTINNINCLKSDETYFRDYPILKITPTLVFKTKTEFYNIIYWNEQKNDINEDKFLVYNNEDLYFFKYDMIKKYISNINSYHIKNDKIGIINYNDNKALLILDNNHINLLDIYALNIIGKIKNEAQFYRKTKIIQINNDEEVLIISECNIYLLNLNKFIIKLHITFQNEIHHSFLLYDKSIIICHRKLAKRYSLKTFENIGIFYSSNIFELYDRYEGDTEDYDYIRDSLVLTKDKILFVLGTCIKLVKLKI
jgi:hypothetical protein